jgi:hypothetical protein
VFPAVVGSVADIFVSHSVYTRPANYRFSSRPEALSTLIRSAHVADAETIAALFSSIVSSLEIYSMESREDEIRKYSPDRIVQLIDSAPDDLGLATSILLRRLIYGARSRN